MFEESGDTSEEMIVAIMNERQYMPDWMKNKYMKPVVCGRGYAGCPDRDTNSEAYHHWRNMMMRAYNETVHELKSAYNGVSVDEEWFNFRNYRKWYDEHTYHYKKHRMDVDKDILFQGNLQYGASTCVIVPHFVNSSVIGFGREEYLPHIFEDENGFFVEYTTKKMSKFRFATEEEARRHLMEYTRKRLDKIAESMKGLIPATVCEALKSWKLE